MLEIFALNSLILRIGIASLRVRVVVHLFIRFLPVVIHFLPSSNNSSIAYSNPSRPFVFVITHSSWSVVVILFVFIESNLALLIAVLPLLRLQGMLHNLGVDWVIGFSQLLVSMREVALVSERAVFVRLVMSAPFGLVLIIYLFLEPVAFFIVVLGRLLHLIGRHHIRLHLHHHTKVRIHHLILVLLR